MTFETQIIATFLIGIAASFIGSIAGSGGLISIPFLIFLGLPPQIAIATNKFGASGRAIGAFYKFWKTQKINWKQTIPLTILAIIGSIIGAQLLINIDKEMLSTVIGVIMLCLLPLIFIKKNIGIVQTKTTATTKTFGYFIYFLIMIFGGFFGGGAGTLTLYCLMYFTGTSIIQSNANDVIPSFFMAIIPLVLFSMNGLIDYSLGLALFVGMIIGGYIGTHIAIKKGNKWVKSIFAFTVLIVSIKIIFFS